jgi:hypothetical protein
MSIALAVLYHQKRGYQCQRPHVEVDLEPIKSSFQPTMFATNPSLNQDTLHHWSLLPNLQNNDISPSPIPPKSDLLSATAQCVKVPASLVAATGTSQYTSSNKPPQFVHTTISPSPVMSTGVSPLTGVHFTEEHYELVRGAPTSLLSGYVNSHPEISPPPNLPKSGIPSATAHAPTSSVAPSQYSSPTHPAIPSEAEAVAHAFSVRSQMGTRSLMGSSLTDEQSELVEGLLRHNVPLPAIVLMIEGMLRRHGLSGSGESSGSQNTWHNGHQEGDNPPGYDFV